MSAGGFLDACGFIPVSAGTGDFVVSAAVTGYQTPASAGAVNLTVYSYRAESADKSQWEEGFGAYTVSSTTWARTTVTANSSGGTGKITFSAAPNVYCVAATVDLQNAGLLTGGTLPDARLSNVITAAGPQGDAAHTQVLTFDIHGRVTTVTNTAIAIASGAVSGLATSATTDATNASNISSGTLASARLPVGAVIAPSSTNAQSGGTYTLVLADAGKELENTNVSTAQTVTVPNNSTVAFPIGTIIFLTVSSAVAGQTSLVGAAGVTVRGTTSIYNAGALTGSGGCLLIKIATNIWIAC